MSIEVIDISKQYEIDTIAYLNRPVFYMAHPVSEDVRTGDKGEHNWLNNVTRARRWLAWLMQNDRTRVYIAPWITEVELVLNKQVVTSYEEALSDDEQVVRHCDGIILVGGGMTSGMKRELKTAVDYSKAVINWSKFYEPWEASDKAGHAARVLLRGMSEGRNVN